jgi:hypothetical protein
MPLLETLFSSYPSTIEAATPFSEIDNLVIKDDDMPNYFYAGYLQVHRSEFDVLGISYYAIDNYTNIPNRVLPVIVWIKLFSSTQEAIIEFETYSNSMGLEKIIMDGRTVHFSEMDTSFFWRTENMLIEIAPAYVMPEVVDFIPIGDSEYETTKEQWDMLRERDRELALRIVHLYLSTYIPNENDASAT